MYIRDIAMGPMAAQDGAHYLFHPDLVSCVVAGAAPNEGWRKRMRHRLESSRRNHSELEVVDVRMNMVLTLDLLVWNEDENKYRIHLDTNRLCQYCPKGIEDRWEDMMGRLVLAAVRRCRLSEWIDDDWLWMGNRRIEAGGEKERRMDVRQIHQLHAILNGLSYLNSYDSNGGLFPNQKADYSTTRLAIPDEARKKKEETAQCVRDLSVMWQCGLARRNRLRASGIYQWDDPRFLSYFQSMIHKRVHIVQKMISLYHDPDTTRFMDAPPRLQVQQRFPSLLDSDLSKWQFVDFETDYQKCIYLVGRTSMEGWQCDWGTSITPASERLLMDRVYQTLSKHKADGGYIAYYFAEDRFWRERCEFHGLSDYADLFRDALDLHCVMEQSPIVIRGVFNFKLKSIAEALYNYGLVNIQQPKGCVDGAESVQLAQQYFRSGQPPELCKILEAYNRFDCDILLEIVNFLRQYL